LNNRVIQVSHFFLFYEIFLSTYKILCSVALSVPADAGDISSLKNAFNTIRTKLGDPEVLLYNAGGASRGKLHISH